MIKYFRWLLIFEWKFSIFHRHLFPKEDWAEPNFTHVIQLFKRYKMAINFWEKSFPFCPNITRESPKYADFRGFHENQILLTILFTKPCSYSKMSAIFRITIENCMKSHTFSRQIFSSQNSPVAPLSHQSWKFSPVVP